MSIIQNVFFFAHPLKRFEGIAFMEAKSTIFELSSQALGLAPEGKGRADGRPVDAAPEGELNAGVEEEGAQQRHVGRDEQAAGALECLQWRLRRSIFAI